MPYLMHVCFDSTDRFEKKVQYFEYRDVRFKLIQNNNPLKWTNVLLTLVPSFDGTEERATFSIAGEFLSALSWQSGASIALQLSGVGVEDGVTLRQCKCCVQMIPQIPFSGGRIGSPISKIPEIETENQRIALTLFREARSSNKPWLAFLFYWQIMEIGGNNPTSWINEIYYKKSSKLYIPKENVGRLPLAGRRLGEYFLDDCRHAIAHIRRKAGKKALKFDDVEEVVRLAISVRVVKHFAAHYIQEVLGLNKKMHLVRKRGRGFPTFVKESELLKYYSGSRRYRSRKTPAR